ncbi:MAG: helicase C-terminal domain-containing protein [Fusobacteriaceae bacterium]
MNIKEKISLSAVALIREEIKNSHGNEVFFRGIVDEDGVVEKVEAIARGNSHSAPAILKRMKKGEVIIHNHPSGFLYPSDADIEVASYYANKDNGGFYIVNNDVTDIYVVVEIYDEKNIPIDIKPYFQESGIISQHFKGFEYRAEQLEMAALIEEGLNGEKKVIVEAGTGTGKTMAYLIPGIEWAVKNKKRIIFSTNTINLQEQLLNKDIPLVKKILGYDFKYMLVKGRGNYLCNRKYYNQLMGEKPDMSEYSMGQKNQFAQILKWGGTTEKGDRAELTFEVDSTVWENFHSETDICAGNRCQYRDECFFFKVRDEKKKADVLITNHHLYFTDLAIRKEIGFSTEYSILPEYHAIVFDEAHNVEKVARDYFSSEVSKLGFVKLLNKIENMDRKKKNNGVLPHVERECKTQKSDQGIALIQELRIQHGDLSNEVKKYFNEIIGIFTNERQETASIRLKPKDPHHERGIEKLRDLTREFMIVYKRYSRTSRTLIKILRELEDEDGNINELIRYLERVDDSATALNSIDLMEDEESIYWIDVNRRKGYAKRVATPLKINSELQKNLFINLKTIIFTSATIAIGKSFKYFKDSIGLTEECVEGVIHSPFNYNEQMEVYITKDMPDPGSREFPVEAANFLAGFLSASQGRCFVLFTAYSALNFIYYSIRDELEAQGIDFFVHGTAPRTHLVEMYKKADKPVLLGTDSFWEGVDIRGEKLSSVVIVKLPFKVPNDPITEAIIENLTQQGRNSFTEYQIPEAVIKFKQGIGRLVRSKSDKGNITILDNRVITKKYGEFFREAIPTEKIEYIEKNNLIKKIAGGVKLK